MISGYVSSQQELVDLLNGCLFGKVGTLDLFLGMDTVSLRIERGLIWGFKLGGEAIPPEGNKKSVLLYHLSEFMESPEAFFTFREKEREGMVELEEPLSVEELVLQLQVVRGELKLLIERVITPMAVVKVLKPFQEADFYEGKSVYHILLSSKGSLVEEIRKLNTLFAGGYLDINQFYSPDNIDRKVGIEYIMKKVEVSKINLVNLLESLHLSKFDGLVEITGDNFEFNLYYKKGRLFAVYPYNWEVFNFLLNPRGNMRMSVLSISYGVLEILMLRHAQEKSISGLPTSFLEVGKTLMGIALERKTCMLTLYSGGSKSYLLFKEGTLLCVVREEGEELKVVRRIHYEGAGWADLVFYQPMENIKYVVYQYLFNLVYGILLRHGGQINHLVFAQLSLSETLKYQEGSILYRKMPLDEEEAFGFLQFLLDLSYSVLGKERLERELEIVLEPYKEVLKILEVDSYFTLPEK
ncbi:MAG: hypothetical protein NZ827_02930 [Aquificaceae bacterium]|nr:hypothetical protein [Aquificaceae bacterium]